RRSLSLPLIPYTTLFRSDRVKNYAAFDRGCLGSGGIDWRDLVEKFCGLYFATETQPRRFSPGFRSWQSLGGNQGKTGAAASRWRSEEHTSELQSLAYLVC